MLTALLTALTLFAAPANPAPPAPPPPVSCNADDGVSLDEPDPQCAEGFHCAMVTPDDYVLITDECVPTSCIPKAEGTGPWLVFDSTLDACLAKLAK